MLGAAIGDICGSIYEWHNIKYKPENLMKWDCHFTDDTAMTAAITEGILEGLDRLGDNWLENPEAEAVFSALFRRKMQEFGRAFPDAGYGGSFARWLRTENPQPYNSWGNGSAMRASCCGWAAKTLEEAGWLGRVSASVTHNHPEGIKGAEVTAECIFLLRQGRGKEGVRAWAASRYDMGFTLDEIRPGYRFDVSCQGSVPQAIQAFLEGDSFEDVIRLAISLGGDSDTIAVIAGGLAEAFYPVPEELRDWALEKLPGMLRNPLLEAERRFGRG